MQCRLFSLAAALLLWSGCGHGEQPSPHQEASPKAISHYACPMHPDQVSDKPGACPICGMDLEPVTAADSTAQTTATPPPLAPGATRYHCPMHPSYIADKPGECPICGMTLVPFEDEQITIAMPGQAEVHISPERQQLIGVQRERVLRRPLDRNLRLLGKVEYDERRVEHIHTRTEGWVKKIYANYTGQFIKKHQPLFTFYSPELEATQEEYLLALRARQTLKDNPFQDVATGAAALLAATRSRLLLWEFGEDQLRQLEQLGKPLSEVSVYAHRDGFVIEKQTVEGMRIEPGADLYTIADLSVVWVYVDLYESDLALVQVGQEALVTLNSYPDQTFRGQVVYLYPSVDPQTRTARARIELANPDTQLKPGMFAQVQIQTARGEGLVVPQSAVLDSGTRKLVFVDRGEGRFEPREVDLGGRTGEGYEVLAGLQEGEQVITSANFLIDSESQLKAALGAMSAHQH
ncbi:MAG: efflux RND transporter periplasmic adaptor subunit [Candidatus Latescibacteria bacterium]|nr:efflux RND transporter periplasmic adaptor subunit [Candidatus Latescibacterota bacterium]